MPEPGHRAHGKWWTVTQRNFSQFRIRRVPDPLAVGRKERQVAILRARKRRRIELVESSLIELSAAAVLRAEDENAPVGRQGDPLLERTPLIATEFVGGRQADEGPAHQCRRG